MFSLFSQLGLCYCITAFFAIAFIFHLLCISSSLYCTHSRLNLVVVFYLFWEISYLQIWKIALENSISIDFFALLLKTAKVFNWHILVAELNFWARGNSRWYVCRHLLLWIVIIIVLIIPVIASFPSEVPAMPRRVNSPANVVSMIFVHSIHSTWMPSNSTPHQTVTEMARRVIVSCISN